VQRKIYLTVLILISLFIIAVALCGCQAPPKKLPKPEICILNGARGVMSCYDKRRDKSRTLKLNSGLGRFVCLPPGDFQDVLDALKDVYQPSDKGN